MHHIFISYSSANRTAATELVTRLRSGGNLVWVDYGADHDASAAEVGIPAGQRHWDVILEAIQRADVLVFLLTEEWLASDYCRREASVAHELGKRVCAIQDANRHSLQVPADLTRCITCEDETALLAHLAQDSELVQAHTRMVTGLADSAPRRTGLRELLLGVEGDADALALSTGDTASAGIQVTAEQQSHIDAVISRSSVRRSRLRNVGIALVAIMMVGLAISMFGLRSAAADSLRKQNERDRALGLSLAQSSVQLAETDTPAALRDATRAHSLLDNRATRSALSQVEAQVDSALTLSAPGVLPLTAAVSEDGSVAALGTTTGLYVFDTLTGQRRFIMTQGPVERIVLTDDGSEGAVVTEGSVYAFDTTTAELGNQVGDQSTVLDLAIGETGMLWWSLIDGSVERAPIRPDGAPPETVVSASGVPSRALSVLPGNAGFGVVTDTGLLNTYSDDGTLEASVSIWPTNVQAGIVHSSYKGGPPGREYLIRCDQTWQASTSWFNRNSQVSKSVSYRVLVNDGIATPADDFAFTTFGLACGPHGGSWAANELAEGLNPWPSTASTPANWNGSRLSAAAQSRQATFFVIADDAGKLTVRQPASGWSQMVTDVEIALPVSGGVIMLSPTGAARFASDSGSPAVPVASLAPPSDIQAWLTDSSQRAYVAAGTQLHQLDSSGLTRSWELGVAAVDFGLREVASGRLLVLLPDRIGLVSVDDSSPIRWTALPPQTSVSSYISADADPDADRAVVATKTGEVQLLELSSGASLATYLASAAGPTTPVFGTVDDTVVVAESSGTLTKLSSTLKPIDRVDLGEPTMTLRRSLHGQMLASLQGSGSYLLIDSESLETRRVVADRVERADRLVPNGDWTTFVVVLHSGESVEVPMQTIP